jgi:hypothetical protein
MLKINEKVMLDTMPSYRGIVTKIKGNAVWVNGRITGYPPKRWIKVVTFY